MRVSLGGENKKASQIDWRRYKNGGKDRDRTGDTRIFSPLVLLFKTTATSAFSTNFPQFKSFYNNSHGFMALRSKNQVIYNGQTENEGKR